MSQSVTRNIIKNVLGIKDQITSIQFEVKDKVLKADVPDDQYWISIKDLLLNREYEYVSEFALRNFKGLVLDVGANSGIFSLLSAMFAEKVISLEPHPDNYRRLEKNVMKNCVKNVLPLNKALWTERGAIDIHEGTHSAEHSIYSKLGKPIKVSTTTIEELINDFGDIDLLKIDIEGAEFPIFENLSSPILERINAVVGEVHLDYGDLNTIIDKLKANGFKVYAFYPPLCEKGDPYSIKVYGMLRLRVLRKLLYIMSPLKSRTNKKLKIVFAIKEKT
jgi:FkbM family methyltransferase